MTKKEAREIITKKKAALGKKLIILGHHYQNDEIIEFCDYIGDSLELARKAAGIKGAETIIFCGVYFMAETASILAPDKRVFIPDPSAGCPLADMARIEDIERAWDSITRIAKDITPVTYVNSSALTKAFCGRNGGVVCTSGNAEKVFGWAFKRTEKVIFFPDMNLGRNTAVSLGTPDDMIVDWNPEQKIGGLDKETLLQSKMVLWEGWCRVHWPQFRPLDVEDMRKRYPGVKIIVHPETDPRTVKVSDEAGSTARILEYARSLPTGETLAIGTEFNLVNRVRNELKERIKIVPLRKVLCKNMARITLEKLARTLSDLENAHEVMVPDEIARDAKVALERMLSI